MWTERRDLIRRWPVRCPASGLAGSWPAHVSPSIESVDDTPDIEHRPGQPRSERDAAFAERFDARMHLPRCHRQVLESGGAAAIAET
jgi:hypothetical protein